jgi:hypothetical protein
MSKEPAPLLQPKCPCATVVQRTSNPATDRARCFALLLCAMKRTLQAILLAAAAVAARAADPNCLQGSLHFAAETIAGQNEQQIVCCSATCRACKE